jgi:YidC/Oxa1 family membrane protein insertase
MTGLLDLFNILFSIPLTNILVLFYKALLFIHIPYALGFAVIVMTAFIKLLLYPLMSSQIKSSKKMQEVAPQIAKMKEKNKNDKAKQQSEMMRIYKENDINPASGCLPVLLQFPIMIALYRSLTHIITLNSPHAIEQVNKTLYFSFLHLEKAWNPDFFGLHLAVSPNKVLAQTPFIILVPLLTALLQFLLSRMMLPAIPAPKQNKDDFQSAIQSQSMFIFPVMIGWFAFTLPFGLSLYWNTFTVFGILQQYLLVGWGGLTPWIARLKNNGKS